MLIIFLDISADIRLRELASIVCLTDRPYAIAVAAFSVDAIDKRAPRWVN